MQRPDKTQSRRTRTETDRVLWEVWDPIRVNDEPAARDEYTSYVGDLYELLIAGASDAELQSHLSQITEERMEVGKGDESATIVALHSIPLS